MTLELSITLRKPSLYHSVRTGKINWRAAFLPDFDYEEGGIKLSYNSCYVLIVWANHYNWD